MDLTFVTIEDDRECILLEEFIVDDKQYVLLVNSMNQDDFIVREVIGNELVGLESEEALQKVFINYIKDKAEKESNEQQ